MEIHEREFTKILVERNFILTYIKKGTDRSGEGAEFKLDGKLVSLEDRRKAVDFISSVLNKSITLSTIKYIDSIGADRCEPFSSLMLDENFDYLIPHPEGCEDCWIRD